MIEIASFNVKTRGPGGGGRTATFAVHDDGTVTRKITSVDGRAVDYKPTPFRHMNEAERRVNLDDGLSALGFLLGVIQAEPEDWTAA